MKPVFEKTPSTQWESFHCEVVRGTSYNATWHFHPEYQLTLVLKSHGHRLVGDNITPLSPGDLVLVGSNLPHVWHQERTKGESRHAVHAIVVRFLETFLGNDFLQIPEMKNIHRLLKRSARGLQVTGKTRESVSAAMQRLAESTGLKRVAELLAILETLAQSKELKPVASAHFVPNLSSEDQGRMERVCDYIHAHLTEPIDRDKVAAQAHLSVGAFSRFFKLRTGKTLPEYVNELRIGRACRLLVEGDHKVADIAMDCGFLNLANFNRRFRDITHLSPREYRVQFQRAAA